MKRLSKARVDQIATLHQRMKEAEAAYEAAVSPVRQLEAGVYLGHGPSLILSECESTRVNWNAILEVHPIPPRLIKKHTKRTPYTRVDIVQPGE